MKLLLNLNRIKSVFLHLMLFLAAMNFQAKFFYFVFLLFFAIIWFQRGIKANASFLIYFGFGLLMAVYNADEGILSMIRCFAPCCFYLVGLNITAEADLSGSCRDEAKAIEKQGYQLLVMIALGGFAHYGLNFFYNFGSFLSRNTRDIWTGAIMAATGQSALACLMLGLAVAMVFYPLRKWHRIAGILSIALILIYNLFLATRTLIVITAILFMLALFFFMLGNRDAASAHKLLLGFSLFALALIAAYGMNIGGIRDYMGSTILFERFGNPLEMFTSDYGRGSAKLSFIANAYKYPFGGLHLRRKFGYAHDLLLDGYDEYGLPALILMLAILITGAVQLYNLLRYSRFSREFKLALLLIYSSALLEFMVEPILAGMAWLFSCYCLVNGCMTSMNWVRFPSEEGAEIQNYESVANQHRVR